MPDQEKSPMWFQLLIVFIIFCGIGAIALPLGLGGFGVFGALIAAIFGPDIGDVIWGIFKHPKD